MEIPSIGKEELKIVLNLAMRSVVMEKTTLFMVPEYNMDDNANQRAVLLEKGAHATNLEALGLLDNVTGNEEFKELHTKIQEKTKRVVKIYTVSPLGIGMYKSHDDVWTDEQKNAYATRLAQEERDKAQLALAQSAKLAEESKDKK